MKQRRFCKITLSIFTAFMMGVTTFAGGVPMGQVSARTVEEREVTDSLLLRQDSQSPDVYYNAGSSMTDFRDETIYFVMTTRFYDGDSSNNVQCWDAQEKNVEDTPWRGDFKGLIEKLDYIKALGFSAIWITPVVENASGYDYHGYHALNFSKVDPRYESSDCTYQDLIDAAHEKGIKIIQDVVFNHTGNWGESNLYKIAEKDYSQDLSDAEASMKTVGDKWPSDYSTMTPQQQFNTREKLLMDAAYDTDNIYHHNNYIKSWETYDEQVTSIAGDCIDLNTENPVVYKYLVDAYSGYIEMGVDAFRVDTVKHVSRLTFNNALIGPLNDAYNKVHGTTGEGNFYMFGEVCTRVRGVWNRDIPAISCPFFTWKESKTYAWDDSNTAAAIATNEASVKQAYEDNRGLGEEPTSNNAFLDGNNYHTPDYSKASGLNVIDFPMHWNFNNANDAFSVAVGGDQYYNDATFNVTYVDSHDYAPDGAPENQRFAGSQAQWAENLSLMFTFRGIPCIYYGSEIEFQKGKAIDVGTTTALANTGRAYFGDHIEGSVEPVGFGRYKNATGTMAETLSYPLSQHIQRLNRLRAAIPALRKGQYSTEGCNGGMSFKRRYTDSTTDSFVLVTISGDATFSGIPNGTYTDAITGDVQNVSGGSLSTSGCSGQGDLRVYVLDTDKTKAPGMIDGKSNYMSGGTDSLDYTKAVDRTIGVTEKVEVTGISLDKTSASLDLGESVKLTATLTPSNATSKTVKWETDKPSVATVNGGTVTAGNTEGTATITATTSNGYKATATITVEAKGVKVTAVTLNKNSIKLDQGKTEQLTATVSPADADAKYKAITWKSDNDSVAKVDQDGVVKAVKEGTATITATTASGVSATATVKVKGSGANMHVNAIYFQKPAGWGKTINAYMWEDGASPTWENKTWPGVAMEVLDEAQGVYGMKWPDGKESVSLKVIFNDGNQQTGNLDAQLNGYYDQTGKVIKTVDPNAKDDDDEEDPVIPKIQASLPSGEITKATEVTYTLTDAKTATYQKNGGEAVSATGSTIKVTVGEGMKKGEVVTITVNAVSVTGDQTTETYQYTYNGEDEKPKVTPKIQASLPSGSTITGVTNVTFTLTDAASASYRINGGSEQAITGSSVTVPIGSGMNQGDRITIQVSATSSTADTVTATYEYTMNSGKQDDDLKADIHISFEDVNATYTYNGSAQKPKVLVTDGNKTLTEGTDYQVLYLNNINACAKDAGNDQIPTVVVKGIGTYSDTDFGSNSLTFTIGQKTLTESNVADITGSYTYSGKAVQPDVTVTDGNVLAEQKDYEIKYASNVNAGEASVMVFGKGNYTGTVIKAFEIQKAEWPADVPTDMSVNAEMETLRNVNLAKGWTWKEEDLDKVIEQGVTFSATAGYEGVDKSNYTNLTVSVQITGIHCTHSGSTVVKGAIPATCTEDGYSGDTYCTDCQTKIQPGTRIPAAGHQWNAQATIDQTATCTEAGRRSIHCSVCGEEKEGSVEVIDALGHTGGVATCSAQAVCNVCHEPYGNLDSSKHGHLQTINRNEATCQYEGYTGDSYCTDCNKTVAFGSVTPRADHTWGDGVQTKAPTATKEGELTYTCTVCGETRIEKLPKTTEQPTTQQPATQQPATQQPATQQPATQQPATEQPTTQQPATQQPTTQQPATQQPATQPVQATEQKTVYLTGTDASLESGDILRDEQAKTMYRVTKATASTKTVQYVLAGSKSAKVVIPDTVVVDGVSYKVTSVSSNAMKKNKSVKHVVLGSNVKTVGNNAFYGCTNLQDVVLPETVTTIGSKAFYNCKNLKSLTIPAKVNKIGSKAFYGCKNLKKITIKTTRLTSTKVGSKAFKGIASKATIKVPKSKLGAYKSILKKKGVGSKATIKSQ